MAGPTCGCEFVGAGNCAHCPTPAASAALTPPFSRSGGPFLRRNSRPSRRIRDADQKSYGGDVQIQKVVTQLRAVQAVDEKYASFDPLIKKMEERVAAANASENQKQDFLNGMRGSLEQKLGVRRDLLRKEEDWIKSTIDLCDFAIAHLADYSIQDNKLYFRSDATKREFFSQQAKAIALHNDFLKAKRAMEESRKNNMNQLGMSPSDLTPAQLGKTK
jgi:DNA repair ATPase RecN